MYIIIGILITSVLLILTAISFVIGLYGFSRDNALSRKIQNIYEKINVKNDDALVCSHFTFIIISLFVGLVWPVILGLATLFFIVYKLGKLVFKSLDKLSDSIEDKQEGEYI